MTLTRLPRDSRRNNPPRAWMQNTNPISRKDAGAGVSQQNGGAVHGRKPTVSPKPHTNKESNTPDMHSHDRLLFLMTAFIVSWHLPLSAQSYINSYCAGHGYNNHHQEWG